jgi:uncharacterized membrane protein YkoI
MHARLTKLVAAVAAFAALAVGGSALATAQQADAPQPANAPATAQQERDDGEQNPSYRSSVTAPDREYASEREEAQALQSLAKLSADEARSAALAEVPGKATEVGLDNENGNVVYSVDIEKSDGSQVDVKVDAGNGTVVHQDADDGDDGREAPERGER